MAKPINAELADRTIAAVMKVVKSNKPYPKRVNAQREWRFVKDKQVPAWMYEQCIEWFTRALQ